MPPLAPAEIARLLRRPHRRGPPRPRPPPHPARHRHPLCRSGRPGPRGLRAAGAPAARPSRQGRQGPHRALRRPLCRRPRRLSRRPGSRPRGRSSSLPATRASTPAPVSGRTGSSNCCAGSARPRASDGSTPIASGTPSPPGRSRTVRGSSMCSTSWATRRRRWSVAIRPPTTRPRSPPRICLVSRMTVRRSAATDAAATAAAARAAFSPAARLLAAG